MCTFIPSFIHSSLVLLKCFILARVIIDPEPIQGTLGMRWEYTLGGIPGNQRAACSGNLAQLMHLLACFWRLRGNQWTQRNPTQKRGEHAQNLHKDSNPRSRSNPGLWGFNSTCCHPCAYSVLLEVFKSFKWEWSWLKVFSKMYSATGVDCGSKMF